MAIFDVNDYVLFDGHVYSLSYNIIVMTNNVFTNYVCDFNIYIIKTKKNRTKSFLITFLVYRRFKVYMCGNLLCNYIIIESMWQDRYKRKFYITVEKKIKKRRTRTMSFIK